MWESFAAFLLKTMCTEWLGNRESSTHLETEGDQSPRLEVFLRQVRFLLTGSLLGEKSKK